MLIKFIFLLLSSYNSSYFIFQYHCLGIFFFMFSMLHSDRKTLSNISILMKEFSIFWPLFMDIFFSLAGTESTWVIFFLLLSWILNFILFWQFPIIFLSHSFSVSGGLPLRTFCNVCRQLIVRARRSVTGMWCAEAGNGAEHSAVSKMLTNPKSQMTLVLQGPDQLTPHIYVQHLHSNA